MSGILRSAGVIAILLLAGLGCLFVLDVIPREMFKELLAKSIAVIAIFAAAGLLIGLLLKRPAQ